MRVEILSTGEELITGQLVDSNAAWLAAGLLENGIHTLRTTSVGDDVDRLAAAMSEMAARSDLVLVTGGLGPTSDDLSAQAAARASGDTLTLNPEALSSMQAFFSRRGWTMPEANLKQAMLPSRAGVLENLTGTAPGFRVEIGGCLLVFMPGVPREMKAMFAGSVLPLLRERFKVGPGILLSRMTVFGLPESEVGSRLSGFQERFPDIRLGFRASFPLIEVKCMADNGQGTDADAGNRVAEAGAHADAGTRMAGALDYIKDKLGSRLFSDQGLTMEQEVGRLLILRRETLAAAESCTGGLVSSLLTDVAGSSGYFLLSAVTYANDAKTGVLGLNPETLAARGAVSEETALEMAVGVRRLAGADWGIATSGIAGPGGGSEEKPVGTVCIGIDGPGVSRARTFRFTFGDRSMNKKIFAVMALEVLRRNLVQDRNSA
jgi:nicotinamide-nucleotide amidase